MQLVNQEAAQAFGKAVEVPQPVLENLVNQGPVYVQVNVHEDVSEPDHARESISEITGHNPLFGQHDHGVGIINRAPPSEAGNKQVSQVYERFDSQVQVALSEAVERHTGDKLISWRWLDVFQDTLVLVERLQAHFQFFWV